MLSNILLTDLELEKREHTFCRYADDCNIYVKSEKAGPRVLESITQYLEKTLKLKVAAKAITRFKSDLKAVFRRGRGPDEPLSGNVPIHAREEPDAMGAC